jgi:hypothetical protein
MSYASIAHAKERGEWGELCFMARAAEHGLRVTKPWGESAPYDFAIEHNGHFLRVQVKCTTKKRLQSYVCSVSSNRGPYSSDESISSPPSSSRPTLGTSSRSPPFIVPSTSGSPRTARTPATPSTKKPGIC